MIAVVIGAPWFDWFMIFLVTQTWVTMHHLDCLDGLETIYPVVFGPNTRTHHPLYPLPSCFAALRFE